MKTTVWTIMPRWRRAQPSVPERQADGRSSVTWRTAPPARRRPRRPAPVRPSGTARARLRPVRPRVASRASNVTRLPGRRRGCCAQEPAAGDNACGCVSGAARRHAGDLRCGGEGWPTSGGRALSGRCAVGIAGQGCAGARRPQIGPNEHDLKDGVEDGEADDADDRPGKRRQPLEPDGFRGRGHAPPYYVPELAEPGRVGLGSGLVEDGADLVGLERFDLQELFGEEANGVAIGLRSRLRARS